MPLTLSYILMGPAAEVLGLVAWRSMRSNLELSLNIFGVAGGLVSGPPLPGRGSSGRIVPLALAMAICLHFGVASNPPAASHPRGDIYGLATSGLGLALIYAGLDQGNRLDWLNSGLIRGLLLSGAILVGAFFVHEGGGPCSIPSSVL